MHIFWSETSNLCVTICDGFIFIETNRNRCYQPLMVEEEYPIHPILDELIQSYKEFKTVVFPRGMPKPVDLWKEILQNLTKYEAHIVLVTGEYLCGDIIKADDLDPPEKLRILSGNN